MKQRLFLIAVLGWLVGCASAQRNPFETLVFRGACDSSAAMAIDERHFIVADDENNQLRIFDLRKPGMPVAIKDVSGRILADPEHPEADIEGCTRLGDLIFWIGSHGRSKSGKWRASRYRFFATRVTGKAPDFQIETVGSPSRLMLGALLQLPGTGLREAVGKVGAKEGKRLAPKKSGMNIESLCASKDGKSLLLGFRNPRPGGKALLIPLLNPREVVLNGAAPKCGPPMKLDFNGHGFRAMEYSEEHGGYLIVAGSHESLMVSHLFIWSGEAKDAPREIAELPGVNPETMVLFNGAKKVLLLSDDGTVMVDAKRNESTEPLENGQCACKTLIDPLRKSFRGFWVEVK